MEFKDLNRKYRNGAVLNPANRPKYFRCEKCSKVLIERKQNGLWYFVFGKQKNEEGQLTGKAPVEIYVYGSLKIKCFRRECGHWNVLNFLPFRFLETHSEQKLELPKNK